MNKKSDEKTLAKRDTPSTLFAQKILKECMHFQCGSTYHPKLDINSDQLYQLYHTCPETSLLRRYLLKMQQ